MEEADDVAIFLEVEDNDLVLGGLFCLSEFSLIMLSIASIGRT